ncbi:MAG: aspartate kinase [Crocinitomix sp.]|nr:aspartate kinase [Crocinitomix sp.]
MRVFKFGGASVKDYKAVINVGEILRLHQDENLVVIVSAMGKTTNALEAIIASFSKQNHAETERLIDELKKFHHIIIQDLGLDQEPGLLDEIFIIFDGLKEKCQGSFGDYDFEYDQIISLGEILSTKIITNYLQEETNFKTAWVDARKLIRTNDRWREGRVDWEFTENLIQTEINTVFENGNRIAVTQGFIGHEAQGHTTTLGREGSDFTAAIFAYCLNATDVTIWKDVPGMLNADPKYFDNTVLLEKISFKEAIELAYFGASVIHPKTIQPLKRKKIPLLIKSFLNPKEEGTIIQESLAFDDNIPSFIFKMNQTLISLTPRDFSFIVEENLERIFGYLNAQKIRVNLMQNSAVSFSFVVDHSKVNLEKLVSFFKADYLVKYNSNLELVTIRHYDEVTIDRLTVRKDVILEQKSRHTARMVLKDLD